MLIRDFVIFGNQPCSGKCCYIKIRMTFQQVLDELADSCHIRMMSNEHYANECEASGSTLNLLESVGWQRHFQQQYVMLGSISWQLFAMYVGTLDITSCKLRRLIEPFQITSLQHSIHSCLTIFLLKHFRAYRILLNLLLGRYKAWYFVFYFLAKYFTIAKFVLLYQD